VSNPPRQPAIPASELERGRAIAIAIACETTRDPDVRQDMIAEAMTGLVEAASRYRPIGDGRLTTYAYARMRGRVLDALRREARHARWRGPTARSRQIRPATGADPVAKVDTNRIRARMALDEVMAAAKNPPNTQEQLVLDAIYSEGQSLSAVAKRTGWSYAATRRRHERALNKLRRHAQPRHWEMIRPG